GILALSLPDALPISPDELYGPAFDPVREIEKFDTLEQLQSWLTRLTKQAVEFINNHKQKVGRNFVEKARQFIEDNFRDPELKLDKVADHVYISSCYLSRLFKEVTTYSFTEYLNRRRIKEAKRLLLTSP